MTKPRPLTRRRFLKALAGTAALGVAVPLYAAEWEPNHLRVTRKTVQIAGWPAEGLRVGQLSDLHCEYPEAVERTRRAAQALRAEAPEVVFLTGDFISGHHAADYARACADALAPLAHAPRGAFAVLGNHDWMSRCQDLMSRCQDLITAELTRVGIHVLRNANAPLPDSPGIQIVGLDSRSMGVHNPIQAMHGVPPNAVKVLLVHEPDYADEAPEGFAFQMSGHSHAGQIRVPGFAPIYCPTFSRRYPEGWQQTTKHPVYTNRGIGMVGPQMRLGSPPEVTVLTLNSSK